MINYANIVSEGFYMEGFECQLAGDEVIFTEGTVTRPSGTFSYDSFSFDCESDPDIPVVYDIYLTTVGVRVMRTEIGIDSIPFYEGEEELVHCLLSLKIEPGASLSNLSLTVRNVTQTEVNSE